MKDQVYIIHVTIGFNGGVGTVIRNIIKYQIQNGYKVGILYPENISDSVDVFLKELGDIVVRLPVHISNIRGLKQITGMPIKVVYKKLLLDPKKQKLIFHAHNPVAVGLLRNIKDLPLICTIHGINTQSSKISHIVTNMIIKKLVKNKHKVVGVSKSVSNFYNSKIKKEYISTVLNGVDIKQKIHPGKKERFTIGFVANINDLKGWRYIFDAYNMLEDEYRNNINLLLAGSGMKEDIDELYKLIKINELENKVKYLGHVDNAGDCLTPSLNLVVLPSKSEGLPMTLVEAIGHGIPILATNVGGIPELLIDGKNGYFIKRDANDIAKKIKLIYDDNILYDELSKNCHYIYNNKFTNEIMNNQYLSLYNGIEGYYGSEIETQ